MLPCTFIKTISGKNEASGTVLFSVHPYHVEIDFGEEAEKTGIVICEGIIQKYPKNMPLLLDYHIENGVIVDRCMEHIEDDEQAIQFLISNKFKRETAEKIVEKNGHDLFRIICKQNALEELFVPGTTRKKVESFITDVRNIIERRRFLEYLSGYKIPYAYNFYKEYGDASLTVLKKNPYLLRFYNVPFSIYDRIANIEGSQNEERRMSSVIYESIKKAEQSGNTCIPFPDLCRQVKRMGGYDAFDTALSIANKNDYECDKTDQYVIYRSEIKSLEEKTAAHVVRLMHEAVHITDKEIDAIEKELGIRYADEQKEAFQLIAGISILTGGPGTGKTTTLNGILHIYEKKFPNGRIALCAPTAAAAKRIKESTGRNAFTIHKLLEIKPTGYGGYLSKNENNQLEYDFVVVDEASMMDLELFYMLIATIKTGGTLLLLGDVDQLSSVGPGDVLHDLIRCKDIRQVHLNRIFRQANESSIVHNSFAIKNADFDGLIFDDESEIHTCETEEAMKEILIETMKAYYNPGNLYETRLFTTAKHPKFALGTEQLNQVMQDIFNPTNPSMQHGIRTFKVGDPVVFIRNNYTEGYMNGDMGVVTEIDSSAFYKKLIIETDEGTKIISGDSLNDVSLSYATTVHKAQGSECETAIILLPSNPKSLLRNDLLYVAATRAKKKNIFIVQDLKYAIENTAVLKRNTGLLEKINEKIRRNRNDDTSDPCT